ncbi:MAG: hypothetical protein FWD08_01985 [Alphaproteobacteria bacterium]|nr:hypothetical protein [Alphaproteobacteria bacterium]
MEHDEQPREAVLDHDDFGSTRPKIMKGIDSYNLRRGIFAKKPVPTFSHPAPKSLKLDPLMMILSRFDQNLDKGTVS